MENLSELVREYRKTKDNKILENIWRLLEPIIKEKASYVYYQQTYPLNLYKPCKFCKNCKKVKGKSLVDKTKICKECKDCKCIKGLFNLYEKKLCDYKDVESDVWLEIMRIIGNYDVTRDFNKYLFGNLWEYKPSFMTRGFVDNFIKNRPLYKVNKDTDEEYERDDFVKSVYTDEQRGQGKEFADYLKSKDEKLYSLLEMIGYKKSLKFIANNFNITIGKVRGMIKKLNKEKRNFGIPVIIIVFIISALIFKPMIFKSREVNYSQRPILLKQEIKQENKIIKWIKKFFKKEEPAKESNWQETGGRK